MKNKIKSQQRKNLQNIRIEVERAILKLLIQHPQLLEKVEGSITQNHFSFIVHRYIYLQIKSKNNIDFEYLYKKIPESKFPKHNESSFILDIENTKADIEKLDEYIDILCQAFYGSRNI